MRQFARPAISQRPADVPSEMLQDLALHIQSSVTKIEFQSTCCGSAMMTPSASTRLEFCWRKLCQVDSSKSFQERLHFFRFLSMESGVLRKGEAFSESRLCMGVGWFVSIWPGTSETRR